ncbi:CapA family protein [bacterium]|nr:CapA family protein [bacterium]
MKCLPLLLLPLLLAAGCGHKEKSLTLMIGGDILLDRGVERSLELYGPDLLLEEVQPLLDRADATLLNLECPIGKSDDPVSKPYVFAGNPAWLVPLREIGVTHLNLANNHALDQGITGFSETLARTRQTGFGLVGIDSSGCLPTLIVKEDVRVVLFSTNRVEVDSSYVLPDQPGPCQIEIDQLAHLIHQQTTEHPEDWIVVLLHWGQEYRSAPLVRQQLDARILVDAGADVVIGHHPHVVQGYDQYNGGLIVYSVGNFLFDQQAEETLEGWVVELSLPSEGLMNWKIHRFVRDPMSGLHALPFARE